ncbi:MAG: HDOD domain-containing protein [Candidatus Berkiella sp.]
MADEATQAQQVDAQKTRLNFEEAKTIADWVALLNDETNPPLGEDVATILKCLPSDPDDFPKIVAILESEELKNKVVRFINDSYFNPAENSLSNIQRSTIILGFRSMRSLGLSAAIFSYLLKNQQEDAFIKEIALAIQAATLAGVIAKRKIRSLNSEPIVTAALFFSIGKLLFMSFGGSNARKYCDLLADPNALAEMEQEIVGFLLKDLTIELGKKWFIGPTLAKAQTKAPDDDIVSIIHLSRELVLRIKEGWDSDPLQESLRELALFLSITFPQAKNLLVESTLRSLETLSIFSENLMNEIHLPEEAESGSDAIASTSTGAEIVLNPSRVTASIQEMSILLGNHNYPSMSDLIVVGLRNIRNSLDVDRAVFSLLSHDRLHLKGKSIDEKKNSGFLSEFKFELNAAEGWLFQCLLREERAVWIGSADLPYITKLRNPSFNKKIGKGPFFIAPFKLQGNVMGFYYVDRQVSSRNLDEKTFEAFKELCITINGFIELVMMRTRQKK